ncbi:MAG: FtsQ-type POTRA domain-containing protein [Candidatus Omnitrophica bacterium]|nr:FtsQ-type POTRA domain-containing protein [Candidatus Omnitrophota bacterium]
MAPKRKRRIIGLLPWVGRLAASGGWWLLRHPQPWLASILLAAGGWALWSYAQRAEAFRVVHVQLPAQSSLRPPTSLIGANLWSVNLQQIAGELKHQQPWLKEVRVVRQMPNAVRIDPVARVPVAQVRTNGWHPIDRDGFILPEGTAEPAERVVRLTGLERAATPLRTGKENTDERLTLALRVLETLRRNPLLARRVTEVNVSDPQQLRFLMDDQTEVRCGSETELSAHLERLRATLRAIARQPVDVAYIDVRFQEPVIGPKT